MPQQLIYTSAPRGLVAGRSGHCTVARSAGMREALMLRLEQLSYYQHLSLAGGQERPISAYRAVDIRGSRFHVLSRIQDAGLDYSGRTNFVAHHLVAAPEEIRQLPTPAVVLRDWSGWLAAWDKEPQQLSNEDWGNLGFLAAASSLPARTWQRLTGDAVNGYGLLELKPGTCLSIDGISEKEALSLLAESAELLELRDTRRNFQAAAWQYTFTTSTQEQDNPADFRWRLLHTEDPGAARIAGASCVSLSGLRASGVTAEERAFAQTGWQAPATVELTLDKGTITEGESVRLEARADGVPFPRLRWFEIEHGRRVELAGRSGPVLQEQPAGRAKRYMVQAENRAGCKESRVAELAINQPLHLAPKEPLTVRPKGAGAWGGHRKTEKEIEADRKRWAGRKDQEREGRKRKWKAAFLVVASLLAAACAVAGIVLVMRHGQKTATSASQASRAPTDDQSMPQNTARDSAPQAGSGAGTTPLVSAVTPKPNPSPAISTPGNEQQAGPGNAGGASTSQTRPLAGVMGTQQTGASPAVSQSDSMGLHLSNDGISSPPLPWEQRVVGPQLATKANAHVIGTSFVLNGCGERIDDTADSFFFVRQRAAKPVTLSARLRQVNGWSPQSRCGIMIRESDDADAPFVFIGMSSAQIFSIHRDTKGGICPQDRYELKKVEKDQAVSFRISERADSFVTEYLLDGTNWTTLTPQRGHAASTTWKENRLVGFAVCSGNKASTVTACFDDIKMNSLAPVNPSTDGAPSSPK
jgi:hypothetical protein